MCSLAEGDEPAVPLLQTTVTGDGVKTLQGQCTVIPATLTQNHEETHMFTMDKLQHSHHTTEQQPTTLDGSMWKYVAHYSYNER